VRTTAVPWRPLALLAAIVVCLADVEAMVIDPGSPEPLAFKIVAGAFGVLYAAGLSFLIGITWRSPEKNPFTSQSIYLESRGPTCFYCEREYAPGEPGILVGDEDGANRHWVCSSCCVEPPVVFL
jgi:hypothetical protein